MELREKLTAACQHFLEERINRLLKGIRGLEDAMQQESKSSAGDKYETSREMISSELGKLGSQLESFRRMKENLDKIARNRLSNTVTPGTIVKTTRGNYFISIPAGELLVEGEKFYTLGLQAPVAQAMLGKSAGESFSWNGRSFVITEIA